MSRQKCVSCTCKGIFSFGGHLWEMRLTPPAACILPTGHTLCPMAHRPRQVASGPAERAGAVQQAHRSLVALRVRRHADNGDEVDHLRRCDERRSSPITKPDRGTGQRSARYAPNSDGVRTLKAPCIRLSQCHAW